MTINRLALYGLVISIASIIAGAIVRATGSGDGLRTILGLGIGLAGGAGGMSYPLGVSQQSPMKVIFNYN